MLSKRKLFHLPYNTDQMTDSLSPSSLRVQEFKHGQNIKQWKSSRILQEEFKYIRLCSVVRRDTSVSFHFNSQSYFKCPRLIAWNRGVISLCYWVTVECKSLKYQSFLLNTLVCLKLNIKWQSNFTFIIVGIQNYYFCWSKGREVLCHLF